VEGQEFREAVAAMVSFDSRRRIWESSRVFSFEENRQPDQQW
jgi:hypothetical protein